MGEANRARAARQVHHAAWMLAATAMLAVGLGLSGTGTPAHAAGSSRAAVAPAVAPASAPLQAAAALPASPRPPVPPAEPTSPGSPTGPGVSVQIDGEGAGRSQAVTIIVLMTVLSVAPALLLLMTSFTKIVIVLGLTRQAMGTPTIPPNQVLVGIALFLSLFVMGPILSQVNDQAIRPYLDGKVEMSQAVERGEAPMRDFMLRQTGQPELQTMITLSRSPQPAKREDVAFTTLLPAFVLSELKSAFIIGFVIFIPFLVIDLVVASVLMSMGMMMLPPVMISLPFKILLFIMVDGWSLITTALVASYQQVG